MPVAKIPGLYILGQKFPECMVGDYAPYFFIVLKYLFFHFKIHFCPYHLFFKDFFCHLTILCHLIQRSFQIEYFKMNTWINGHMDGMRKESRLEEEKRGSGKYLGDCSGHSGGRWCEIYSTSGKVGGEEWIHFGI